jgi:hypothetical protein
MKPCKRKEKKTSKKRKEKKEQPINQGKKEQLAIST